MNSFSERFLQSSYFLTFIGYINYTVENFTIVVITKIHFQPRGSGFCVYDYCWDGIDGPCNDRHRNAYIWSGSYYYLFGKLDNLILFMELQIMSVNDPPLGGSKGAPQSRAP